MLTQLIHIIMVVPDVRLCQAFYGTTLNLPDSGGGIDSRGQNYRKYLVGHSELILVEDSSAIPYSKLVRNTRTEVDHYALYVEDLETVFEALQQRGIVFQDKPHKTELGHRNIQRSLVSFKDPNGFTLQLSQTVDLRPQLAPRKEAKRAMANLSSMEISTFGGIDHVSSYCTNFKTNRKLYRDILKLNEFFYSTVREDGVRVTTGFEQGAFAIGGTDIELASDDEWQQIVPGPIHGLGFRTDQIENVAMALRSSAVSFEETTSDNTSFHPGRNTLVVSSPDGMQLQIVQ